MFLYRLPKIDNLILTQLKGSIYLFFIVILIFSGCSSRTKFKAPVSLPADNMNINEPKEQYINYGHDWYNKSITLQIAQTLDISRQSRKLFGRPKQALNINAFDEVPHSTWFINRNAFNKMSIDEVVRGSNKGAGPDTSDFWTITRAKSQGVTPGFHIKDCHGNGYVIKFDQLGFNEMATGAEVITTKLFHAMGYNVPENYLTYFDPAILKLGDKVKIVDEKGRKRFMTSTDVEGILSRIAKLPNGRIRAVASKYVPGKPIGGFYYDGTRKDDPNDIVPHEHRRELRGLKVPSFWVKHFDTKAGNNLDVYVTENGCNYVKHYLIDFGATLGSYTYQAQDPFKGHEMDLDFPVIALNILSFGLYVKEWEKLEPVKYVSVGRFDSHDFKPGKTKPNWPNTSFENCTNRDGFWGTKLVVSLTDEQIEAAVKVGEYSNPDATAYVIKILQERRDKTGRYWFSKVNPLDNFKITTLSNSEQNLKFKDLSIDAGFESKNTTSYIYSLIHNNTNTILDLSKNETKNTKIVFSKELISKVDVFFSENKNNDKDNQLFHIKLFTKRSPNSKQGKWINVHLEYQGINHGFKLIGLEREE